MLFKTSSRDFYNQYSRIKDTDGAILSTVYAIKTVTQMVKAYSSHRTVCAGLFVRFFYR